MGPLGELGALFNPGMRHELEERRSKAMRREEEGNARDGDLRIDLESGVAVISSPGSARPARPATRAGGGRADERGDEAPAASSDDSEGKLPVELEAPTDPHETAPTERTDPAGLTDERSAATRRREERAARTAAATDPDRVAAPRAEARHKQAVPIRPTTKAGRSR